MQKNKLTIQIFFFLFLTDILETFIQSCFKKTALFQSNFYINNLTDIFIFVKNLATNPTLWLALTAVLLVFIMWSTILSKIDLSIAVPIASFSYIFVPIASIIIFNEKISLLRWTGISFIIAGVIFVSLSSRQTSR